MAARISHLVLLATVLLGAAACGAASDDGSSERPAEALSGGGERLEHYGVSLMLPVGWEGRVLALDYPSAALQAGNFELTRRRGEPPLGAEDPIKSMTAEDVLVTILPCGRVSFEEAARAAPEELALAALTFLSAGHARTPHGHAFAHGSFEFDDRCLRIEADFGATPASSALGKAVDDVLRSLVVERQ